MKAFFPITIIKIWFLIGDWLFTLIDGVIILSILSLDSWWVNLDFAYFIYIL